MKTFIDLMKDKEDNKQDEQSIRKAREKKEEYMMLYGLGMLNMLFGFSIGQS